MIGSILLGIGIFIIIINTALIVGLLRLLVGKIKRKGELYEKDIR